MSYLRPRPCHCIGYWFPHRRGGGACEHSTSRMYHLLRRHGETDPEALLDAWLEMVLASRERGLKNAPCPF